MIIVKANSESTKEGVMKDGFLFHPGLSGSSHPRGSRCYQFLIYPFRNTFAKKKRTSECHILFYNPIWVTDTFENRVAAVGIYTIHQ